MKKAAVVVSLLAACWLSGCVIVAPYNQTPAELKSEPAKYREEIAFPLTFDQFLQAAYQTQTTCGEGVTFVVSPDRSAATAMITIPGLTSTATVALAEARPEGNGTAVKVWAQNNGFAHALLTGLRQIGSPPTCR